MLNHYQSTKFQNKLDFVGQLLKEPADEDQIPQEIVPVKKGKMYEEMSGEVL